MGLIVSLRRAFHFDNPQTTQTHGLKSLRGPAPMRPPARPVQRSKGVPGMRRPLEEAEERYDLVLAVGAVGRRYLKTSNCSVNPA